MRLRIKGFYWRKGVGRKGRGRREGVELAIGAQWKSDTRYKRKGEEAGEKSSRPLCNLRTFQRYHHRFLELK